MIDIEDLNVWQNEYYFSRYALAEVLGVSRQWIGRKLKDIYCTERGPVIRYENGRMVRRNIEWYSADVLRKLSMSVKTPRAQVVFRKLRGYSVLVARRKAFISGFHLDVCYIDPLLGYRTKSYKSLRA